jgi:hypothetical protein
MTLIKDTGYKLRFYLRVKGRVLRKAVMRDYVME